VRSRIDAARQPRLEGGSGLAIRKEEAGTASKWRVYLWKRAPIPWRRAKRAKVHRHEPMVERRSKSLDGGAAWLAGPVLERGVNRGGHRALIPGATATITTESIVAA
jgi:hypothetical protein